MESTEEKIYLLFKKAERVHIHKNSNDSYVITLEKQLSLRDFKSVTFTGKTFDEAVELALKS